MKVVILDHTENPEYTCAKAMRSTRMSDPAHEFVLGKEDVDRLLRKAKADKHFGTFEHAYFTVSVSRISRVCTHQLVRHRLFSFMQTSGLVIDPANAEFIIPPSIEDNKEITESFKESCRRQRDLAVLLEHSGIPREDARFVLPEATSQNIVISGNARQWMHFLWMRASEGSHAQWEIKEMARLIHEELKELAPVIFEEVFEC